MLEARNVTFGYGGPPLFKGLTLTCEPDERVALVAPSGVGKTTLCRLLAGYLQPDAGAILLDGASLPTQGLCPVQLIGQNPVAVLDERMRLGDSLAEACPALRDWRSMSRFGGTTSSDPSEAIIAALDAVALRPAWFHRFPHELSGGELQRFCIARTLLAHPRYIIADEITTMLDAVLAARIWEVLRAYLSRESAGLVFVTHDSALLARLATRKVSLARD